MIQQWRADILEGLTDKRNVVIFGAGSSGVRFKCLLQETEYKLLYFCDNDNNRRGQYLEGVKIISPEELRNLNDKYVIFICSQWFKEIETQLVELELFNFISIHYDAQLFDEYEQLYEVNNLLEDDASKAVFETVLLRRITSNNNYLYISDYPEYIHPIVHPKKDDVIIDGGAFNGDTVKKFADYLNNQCTIFSFEPCFDTYKSLMSFIKTNIYERTTRAFQLGLSNNRRDAFLNKRNLANPGGFRISEVAAKNYERIETISLDDFVAEHNISRVDYIKLDVEGCEFEALEGATRTIETNRPILNVCIYHKPKDLYELPFYIREKFKKIGYKFYLGHHDKAQWGTVLYALPQEKH